MKKITLFIILGMISISLQAQESGEEDYINFKPQFGDIATEVSFSPFSSNPIYISNIKLRFFKPNDSVFRFGFLIGGEIQKPTEDVTLSTIELSLRPGFEKHFEGTERLSPYIGYDFEFSYKYSRVDLSDTDVVITGAWDEFGTEQGFIQIGANLLIGADFYIAKRIYLGTEFGFGMQLQEFTNIKTKVDGDETGEISRGGSFAFGPNYNGALRLGFSF